MISAALAASDLTTSSVLTGSAFSTLSSLGLFSGIWLFLWLPLYIYMAWALMVIAQKTNTPNPWLAWIPIGNLYLMTQIAGVPWWTILVFLLMFIPVLNLGILAVYIWWWWKICEKRGMPQWYGVLAALTFIPLVPLIFIGIIAWGK